MKKQNYRGHGMPCYLAYRENPLDVNINKNLDYTPNFERWRCFILDNSSYHVGTFQQWHFLKIHSLSGTAQDLDGLFDMMPRHFDPHNLPSGHIC